LKTAKISAWTKTRVRSYIGWYRHITLVLLALAYLAGICATERFSTVHPTTSESATRPSALALTMPEVRHLLARLIWPLSSSTRRVLAWSWWRRCHQSTASYYHIKRRVICWLILAGSHHPLGFVLARAHFLDFPEISWKCRSSWKSVRVLSSIVSFLERSSDYDHSSCRRQCSSAGYSS